MSTTKLETTSAAKTIQAWKDAAREAGVVLEYNPSSSSTDYPVRIVGQNERLKKIFAMAKNGKVETVIQKMFRQKHGKKEYLTYSGELRTTNHRGVPYSMYFEAGKYQKPRIVINPGQKYNQDTGEPLYNEKILSGQETVYDIEITDKNRKQIIDKVIGDTDPESIQFYFVVSGETGIVSRRDNTFSYQDFTTKSINELRDSSARSGGSRSLGYHWKDGKLVDRDNNPVK